MRGRERGLVPWTPCCCSCPLIALPSPVGDDLLCPRDHVWLPLVPARVPRPPPSARPLRPQPAAPRLRGRDTLVPSNTISTTSEELISFYEVDIVTLSQKLLASRLSCNVVQGKSLLLTGPNGSGKSSVFRVLRDLWPSFSGRVTRPSEGMFHVPHRPYTSLCTLRDIIYPSSREEAELEILTLYRAGDRSSASVLLDDRLKTVLVNVWLVYLLERDGWDSTPNWEDVLSLEEQQRLEMARLLFHHPKFGILDECTGASVDVEEHLYRLATNMGITMITSSQRPALIPFHSLELKLIDVKETGSCARSSSD